MRRQDKIFLKTKINMKNVEFLIDTGATHSVLSEEILISVMPNYKKQLKKADSFMKLRGVTGNVLRILGYYRISLWIPEIGKFPFYIFIVTNPNVAILGMDFMNMSSMSLIFQEGKYLIQFPESLLAKTRTVYNETSIDIPANSTAKHSFNVCNTGRNYPAKLLHRPRGLVMPDSLINISGSSSFGIIFGNSTDSTLNIKPYGVKIIINPCDYLVNRTEEISNIFQTLEKTSLIKDRSKGIPDILRPYYTNNELTCHHDFSHIRIVAREDCVNIATCDVEIEKSETSEFDLPDSLVTHEIDIPTPVSRKEVTLKIQEICSNYDNEVVKYLKPALFRNQDLLCKNSWDIATTKECLDFNFKHPIPKNTKIYPIKPEFKANFLFFWL